MARNKKESPDSEKNLQSSELNNASIPEGVKTIEDKLQDAAGNINRAADDSKTRDDMLAKQRKEDAKEKRARDAEKEKQRRAAEKEARAAAAAKLAELEYAESYRKKLQKEKKKSEEERKLREKEAKEAEKKAAEEASAKRIAEILEAERADARRRSERAAAVLDLVNNRNKGSADSDASEKEAQEALDNAVLRAVKEAEEEVEPAENIENAEVNEAADDAAEEDPAELYENGEAAEGESDLVDEDADGEADEEDTAPDEASDGVTITVPYDGEPDVNIIYSDEPKAEEDGEDASPEEKSEDDDGDVLGDVEKWFSGAGKKNPDGSGDSDDSDEDVDPFDEVPSFNSRGPGKSGGENASGDRDRQPRRRRGKDRYDDEPITEDLFEENDIVEEIRAEGKLLKNRKPLHKKYADNSRKAISDFTRALKEGHKSLSANRDESQTPEILVNLMKITAKILEIRCDNLQNYVRTNSSAYIKGAKLALRKDINAYNELAAAYSALTGEQLTRLSTFLPDQITAGKAAAVIPKLSFKESYVQIYPDENGNLPNEDGASLTRVSPPATADAVFVDLGAPKTKLAIGGYIKRAKKAITVLQGHSDRIKQTIAKTNAAERKYKSELRTVNEAKASGRKSAEEYKRAVFELRFKYGKRLTSIKTSRIKYAFAKTKVRLLAGCFALEREKLAVAYRLLCDIYENGKSSQKAKIESMFSEVVESYNKYAKRCEKNLKAKVDTLPATIFDEARKSREKMIFPMLAYKRELVETVGDASHIVSMALKDTPDSNEQAYIESSNMILNGTKAVRDRVSLTDDAPMVDRASSIAKVLLDMLREYADSIGSVDEFELYTEKSERTVKYFKKSLKRTEIAIAKAFDENGVVTALVENLRVISHLIEVRRINIALAKRLKRNEFGRNEGRALYKDIELYNGRAIDYMSIVGEQFTRITTAPISVLTESADKLRVPQITYKDNYIEVFPKDPLKEPLHEKPTQRRGGYYTPLLMKHFRLTENRAVETTVVNSPFVFDVIVDELPVVSWWHPTGFWLLRPFVIFQPIYAAFQRLKTDTNIGVIMASLELSKSGLDGRSKKSEAKRKRLEAKIARLNDARNAKILALETVVHDKDRNTLAYQKKLNRINTDFSRKICKLKLRWMQNCPSETKKRQMLERLVMTRELLVGVNKLLIKYRNYGRITFSKNAIVKYKRMFLDAIKEHNDVARQLSEMVGVEFSEVSSTVADEIVRYGNMIRFPQIVCCREVIETIGDVERSIGDKWHGYGLYTQDPGSSPSGTPPVMSVGAMGYSTNMGIPYFNADFNSMSIIGMTPKGVPLIGFNNNAEAAIPFSGIPMMMKGEDDSPVLDAGMVGSGGPLLGGVNVTNPYTAINSGAIDSTYVENIEDQARNGVTIETPIDLETAMVEERFLRSLRARSMTTVDGIGTWWRLIGSEINVMIQRNMFLRFNGFLRILLPRDNDFIDIINASVPPATRRLTGRLLADISKLSSIINIEAARLYSATKAGIRRSQRRFSRWLTSDIEVYNKLVAEYNRLSIDVEVDGRDTGIIHPRWREHEKIRPISLSLPDKIRHRVDDRPKDAPKLQYRDRVRTRPFGWNTANRAALDTNNMIDSLVRFANAGWFRFPSPLRIIGIPFLLIKIGIVNLLNFLRKHNWPIVTGILTSLLCGEMTSRLRRTKASRNANEWNHYYIRYEKARAMKRYNKQMLGAIGSASDPILYQKKVHSVLRKYVSTVFRIDYNMRIYQLIERMLRVSLRVYLLILVPAFALMLASGFAMDYGVFMWISFFTICWAALPIVFLILQLVYWIVYMIVALVRMFIGNKQQLRYGAKEVEKERYECTFECFRCEQYKVLAHAAVVRAKHGNTGARRRMLAAVNDYNKHRDEYSKMLRVSIEEIEPSMLIEKLTSNDVRPLTEIQNFAYFRELIQVNDKHDVGERLGSVEMEVIRSRLNQYISYVSNGMAPYTEGDLEVALSDAQALINQLVNPVNVNQQINAIGGALIAAVQGFDFINNQNTLLYINSIQIAAGIIDSNSAQRKRAHRRLRVLVEELSGVKAALGSIEIEQFSENVRLVLNERAKDHPNMTDEERFRVKEEIVDFIGRYPVDTNMLRDEIARDFIKFIDDVGGTPERVIISSLALDDMVF